MSLMYLFSRLGFTMKRRPFVLLCALTLLACSDESPGSISIEGPASVSVSEGENASFGLKNVGGSLLDWSIEVHNGADNPSSEDWFTLSQTKGQLEPDSVTTLELSLIGTLPEGRYKAELDVSYLAEKTSFEVLGVIGAEDANGSATLSGTLTTDNKLISVVPAKDAPVKQLSPRAASEPQGAYVPGQLLVKYAEPLATQSAAALTEQARVRREIQARYHLRTLERGIVGRVQQVDIGDQDVLELANVLNADPRVSYAEPVYYLQNTDLPNDEFIEDQWWLASAGVPVAWGAETGDSADVVVAIIDSGFDLAHPDLAGRFLEGIDFCAELKNRACSGVDEDPSHGRVSNTHGTHVAGIVGASANNGQGVAGVAHGSGIKLLPVKIFDDSGNVVDTANFIKGVLWAAGLEVSIDGKRYQNPNPADIINMSLGGFFDSKAVQEAVAEARAAGTVLLAASGNSGLNQIISPAAVEDVIAVGSVNPDFRRSCFSNYGTGADFGLGKLDLVVAGGEGPATEVEIAAPPECAPETTGVYSTYPANSYGVNAGTSMATPLAAGIAALILAQRPELTAEQLEAKLLASTYFDPSYMTGEEYGAGILRADYALNLPGPGAEATVSASNDRGDFIDTVKLDLLGGSASYTLEDLPAGDYRVKGVTGGSGVVLEGGADTLVSAGETKNLDIRIQPTAK